MKTIVRNFVVLVAGALLLMPSALAQSGSGGEFVIHNLTDNNVVVGFYTNDGSGWSTNWLSEQLNPGEQANAAFDAVSGSCDQTFQVGWLGSSGGEVFDEPIGINICDASNVYLADNEMYYD